MSDSRVRPSRLFLPLLAALLASSCVKVGPDYEAPAARPSAEWSAPADATIKVGGDVDAEWWKTLGDPLLDDLVARTVANNTDVKKALAQFRAARAARRGATAALFPSLDASAAYERRRPSGTTVSPTSSREFDDYSAGFDSSWEIDLFGGLRRAREQAGAEVDASRADLHDVLVSVTAEVARNYVELRSLQQRIRIAEDNAHSQLETLDLARWRFQAGLVPALDVDQAEYTLADTRSRIPALETEKTAAANRIAVLTGQNAGALAEELAEPRPVPSAPVSVTVGVPADLLRRRPDVAAAERRLAAATAAVGVAASDLYPKLSLSGTFQVAATDFSDLGSPGARGYGVGPTLRWDVFDAGRVRSVVNQRSAETDAALADWEKAVLGAGEEAQNALVAYVRERERRGKLAEAREAATRAHDLARVQYEHGLVDFQRVLEAQRAALVFEESLAISEAAVTSDLVALYKALAGGWQAASCDDSACR